MLETMQKLARRVEKVHLIVLSETASKDVELRQKVLEYQIKNTILFLDGIKSSEKFFYYTGARAVLYPSIYESFCFDFISALSYGVPIIANDLKSTREIFGDSIHYANFLSAHRASERIEKFLNSGEGRRDYSEIFEDMTPEKTVAVFGKTVGIESFSQESELEDF